MTITDTTASGTFTLCSGPLNSSGELASCSLGTSTLPVGTNQITTTYLSDGVYAGSATSRTVTVVPVQSTTTALTLSSPSVPFASEQTEVLTPEDIADGITYMVTRPRHTAIGELWIMPTEQL